eukprot:1305853-Rhodomonas_salina.2
MSTTKLRQSRSSMGQSATAILSQSHGYLAKPRVEVGAREGDARQRLSFIANLQDLRLQITLFHSRRFMLRVSTCMVQVETHVAATNLKATTTQQGGERQYENGVEACAR